MSDDVCVYDRYAALPRLVTMVAARFDVRDSSWRRSEALPTRHANGALLHDDPPES